MPRHHRGTESFVQFMRHYLEDHNKTCRECGYTGESRSEWHVQKRRDEGLHYVHKCPKCGAVDDLILKTSGTDRLSIDDTRKQEH